MFPFWAIPMKEHRTKMGISRKEVAALISRHPNHYSLMESGRVKPGKKVMLAFARATGMEADYALTLIGAPPDHIILEILKATGHLPTYTTQPPTEAQ